MKFCYLPYRQFINFEKHAQRNILRYLPNRQFIKATKDSVAPQEPSVIQDYILANTANCVVAHLNNEKEIN